MRKSVIRRRRDSEPYPRLRDLKVAMTCILALATLTGCLSQPLSPKDSSVDPAVVAEIRLSPDTVRSSAGQPAWFSVVALDADGKVIQNPDIVWGSDNPSTAIVDRGDRVWSFTSDSIRVTVGPGGSSAAAVQGMKAASVVVTAAQEARPAPVVDLKVDTVVAGRVTLEFKEVDDGTGSPADYLMRFRMAPLSWGTAANVTYGTCGGVISGSSVGNRRTCTVTNLLGGTTYEFQLIAYRGDIATDGIYGDLSNIVAASTPATAWVVEDWSGYASIGEYLEKTEDGRYRTRGLNSERMAFDAGNGYGGSPHSLRYTFPNRTGDSNRCHDYSIGRDMYLPAKVTEVWVETWVKFAPNFVTKAPESWDCTTGQGMKLLFGTVPDGNGRFGIKLGIFGDQWAANSPDNESDEGSWDRTNKLNSLPYMDGKWHRVRTHWKVGKGNGVAEVWIDDHKLYEHFGMHTDADNIWGLKLGANRNQGPHEAMSYWWGRVAVWKSKPDWAL